MKGHDLRREDSGHDIIFAEARGGKQVMARTLTRKLILAELPGEKMKFLYDLKKDPLEKKNVYRENEYRSEATALEAALEAWRHKDPVEIYLEGPAL